MVDLGKAPLISDKEKITEEKPAGQLKQNCPPPHPPELKVWICHKKDGRLRKLDQSGSMSHPWRNKWNEPCMPNTKGRTINLIWLPSCNEAVHYNTNTKPDSFVYITLFSHTACQAKTGQLEILLKGKVNKCLDMKYIPHQLSLILVIYRLSLISTHLPPILL